MGIRGHCLCGTVRLELIPPTELCAHCHCESCRRAHAAAFVSWVGVPAEQLRIVAGEAALERYQSSPGAFRCFCRRCGTSMLTWYTADHREFGESAGRRYIPLAVLADPLDREPSSHVSFEERVAWFPFSDALPRFRGKSDEPITARSHR